MGILNSAVADERLQVLAYLILNTGHRPTKDEIVALAAARLDPALKRVMLEARDVVEPDDDSNT